MLQNEVPKDKRSMEKESSVASTKIPLHTVNRVYIYSFVQTHTHYNVLMSHFNT